MVNLGFWSPLVARGFATIPQWRPIRPHIPPRLPPGSSHRAEIGRNAGTRDLVTFWKKRKGNGAAMHRRVIASEPRHRTKPDVTAMNENENRAKVCRKLGFSGVLEVHTAIVDSGGNPETLRRKGLDARSLEKLGYPATMLAKLGFEAPALMRLGFSIPRPKTSEANARSGPSGRDSGPDVNEDDAVGDPELERLRAYIKDGLTANEIKSKGHNVHQCKRAGFSPDQLGRIGFLLPELRTVYSIRDLKRSNFGARELRQYFTGHELKSGGFQASDMKGAGFGVEELLRFGYSENHVRTAGYSIIELDRAGLSRNTVDNRRFHN